MKGGQTTLRFAVSVNGGFERRPVNQVRLNWSISSGQCCRAAVRQTSRSGGSWRDGPGSASCGSPVLGWRQCARPFCFQYISIPLRASAARRSALSWQSRPPLVGCQVRITEDAGLVRTRHCRCHRLGGRDSGLSADPMVQAMSRTHVSKSSEAPTVTWHIMGWLATELCPSDRLALEALDHPHYGERGEADHR